VASPAVRDALFALGASPSEAHEAKESAMPVCKGCGEEVDELESVRIDGRTKKLCEECADVAREQAEIAEQSESVVQDMMGFKGRR
jgi:ribosome-binding protein aMBF1 (putative translation factor)